MTPIPCRRPKVETTASPTVAGAWTAQCRVPGCTWTYGWGVRSDVDWRARLHRAEHRDTVPTTTLTKAETYGYLGECDCGWSSDSGHVTRTDVEACIVYHLSHDHGLVSC